jgi:hypothetical protein
MIFATLLILVLGLYMIKLMLSLNIVTPAFPKENQVHTYMHARIKFHAYSDI